MRATAAKFDADAQEQAREIAGAGAALAESAGFEAAVATARGKSKAWPTLLHLAEDHDAAAIVIGCQGVGPIRAALIGSVANGVLHDSHRPVLVVPPARADTQPAGPLVLAYHGSEHARRGIAAARALMPGRRGRPDGVNLICHCRVGRPDRDAGSRQRPPCCRTSIANFRKAPNTQPPTARGTPLRPG